MGGGMDIFWNHTMYKGLPVKYKLAVWDPFEVGFFFHKFDYANMENVFCCLNITEIDLVGGPTPTNLLLFCNKKLMNKEPRLRHRAESPWTFLYMKGFCYFFKIHLFFSWAAI